MKAYISLSFLVGALLTSGCGGGGGECDPVANTGCDKGKACETVQGGGPPICVSPVVVKGRVFKVSDNTGIGGARVVATNVNGAPVSTVATSNTDGTYELPVPNTRDANGAVVAQQLKLRADAQGFVTFPSGVRPSLPISTSGAADDGSGKLVVKSSLTDIGLIAEQGAGTASIAGHADVPTSRAGILVVAEDTAAKGYSAFADSTGDYRIFNVPAGNLTVKGYAQTVNYNPVAVALAQGENKTGVDLHLNNNPTHVVSGSVDIVASFCVTGPATEVILAVASTFNNTIAKGETPPGLRAPPPPQPPNIQGGGTWTISGVPDGTYVVLAAFENDKLVRDPSTIGGTAIQRATVAAADVTAGQFKVTCGVTISSPGAGDTPERVTNAHPTFSWVDYPSTNKFFVDLFDSQGNDIWPNVDVGGALSAQYTGASATVPLVAGNYYQWRVRAVNTNGNTISFSEDLKGVFLFQP